MKLHSFETSTPPVPNVEKASDADVEDAPEVLLDKKGNPLKLYRGSCLPLEQEARYDKEQLGHSTGAPSASEGFFFTSRKKTAEGYSLGDHPNKESAIRSGGEPHIDTVHLVMKNPFIHDFKGKIYRDETYHDLIRQAREAGHDGVIFKNTYDSGKYGRFDSIMRGHIFPEDIYIVFEPEQALIIKQEETVSARKKQRLQKKYGKK